MGAARDLIDYLEVKRQECQENREIAKRRCLQAAEAVREYDSLLREYDEMLGLLKARYNGNDNGKVVKTVPGPDASYSSGPPETMRLGPGADRNEAQGLGLHDPGWQEINGGTGGTCS